MNETTNIVLDSDLDDTVQQDDQTLIFRSGNVIEGDEPIEGEPDTRIKHPFAVTITKDANMNTEDVQLTWVNTEPDNSDIIAIQIKSIFNF